jgi:MFS family permease
MPALRILAVLVGGLAFAQAMVMAVLVLFALRDLGVSEAGYGLLLGVAAFGNVAGSLVAFRLRERLGAAGLLVGAGLVAAGAYLVMAATTSAPVAAAALLVECVAVACGSVASMSLRQRVVPSELLGRVGNAFRVCIWGALPVGALAGGAVAAAWGTRAVFVVAGLAQVVLVVATRRRLVAGVADLEQPVLVLP